MKTLIKILIVVSLLSCSKEGRYKLTYDYTATKEVELDKELNYQSYSKKKKNVYQGDNVIFRFTRVDEGEITIKVNLYLDGNLHLTETLLMQSGEMQEGVRTTIP